MGLRRLPWWARIAGKLALSRLPVPYALWRRLGLFRHGEMNRPERAIQTFESYLARAQRHGPLKPGYTVLELGPGDSILSGIVARAMGASRSWLVDAGDFADTDLAACRSTARLLAGRGLALPDISDAQDLAEVLGRMSITYLTRGTDSLASIPDASVDFFWSQVVLEHVPRQELPRCLRELRRIAAGSAIGVHSIDFRDHLGGALNSLRFPNEVWEGRLFRDSGFYTNRLRPREVIDLFTRAGFEVEVTGQTRWPGMVIGRSQLAREFWSMPDEDFMVAEMDIIVRPRA